MIGSACAAEPRGRWIEAQGHPFIRFFRSVALVAAFAPSPEAADCPGSPVPSAEYAKLVSRYQSATPTGAVAALGNWNEARLDCELKNLRAAAGKAAKCVRCPEKLAFERFSLRAALLLHADKEASENLRPPVSEQPPPSCGTGPHERAVERLADLLLLLDPSAADFLRRFYLGAARHAHWSHCLRTAQQWARSGLKRFPSDGPLLLTLGIAAENDAFHERAPTSRKEGMSGKQRALWEEAQRTFEAALGVDPRLDEADLRLGRVLWRLGQTEAARVRFEALLAKDPEASLRYLAHLFLGRIHQDDDRLAEAEKQYAAALLLRPASEPAAVAVSYTRQLLGNPESARAVLNRFLVYPQRRRELDPYIDYLMAHTGTGERILERLRTETGG